jgi:hypothetical protein
LQKNSADERAHSHYAQVLWHRGRHDKAVQHLADAVFVRWRSAIVGRAG